MQKINYSRIAITNVVLLLLYTIGTLWQVGRFQCHFSSGQLAPVPYSFYQPHPNSFFNLSIGGINGLSLFYLIFMLSWITSVILQLGVFKIRSSKIIIQITLSILFMVYVAFTVLQSLSLCNFIRKCDFDFHGPFNSQPYAKIPAYREPYQFAKTCQERLPGVHKAKFITDMDLMNSEQASIHRALAYFLYPIDIREVQPGPYDCLVIYHKRNPERFIERGFKSLLKLNDSDILAIKE
jgi:hypothetical protein